MEEEDNEIYTCAATVAEVISKTARERRNPETACDILVSDSNIIDVDEELSKDAGILHAINRIMEKLGRHKCDVLLLVVLVIACRGGLLCRFVSPLFW